MTVNPAKLFLPALLFFSGVCLSGCSDPAPITGIPINGPVSLLDLFSEARKTTTGNDWNVNIQVTEAQVEEAPERVLLLHPKSEVIFPLKILRPAILETAVALRREAWEKEGDGATFYVAVRQQGEVLPTYLFSQRVYPQLLPEHRGWQPVRLDLTAYREKDIELILGTDPGPNNNVAYDWAVWRDPRIYNPATDIDVGKAEDPLRRN